MLRDVNTVEGPFKGWLKGSDPAADPQPGAIAYDEGDGQPLVIEIVCGNRYAVVRQADGDWAWYELSDLNVQPVEQRVIATPSNEEAHKYQIGDIVQDKMNDLMGEVIYVGPESLSIRQMNGECVGQGISNVELLVPFAQRTDRQAAIRDDERLEISESAARIADNETIRGAVEDLLELVYGEDGPIHANKMTAIQLLRQIEGMAVEHRAFRERTEESEKCSEDHRRYLGLIDHAYAGVFGGPVRREPSVIVERARGTAQMVRELSMKLAGTVPIPLDQIEPTEIDDKEIPVDFLAIIRAIHMATALGARIDREVGFAAPAMIAGDKVGKFDEIAHSQCLEMLDKAKDLAYDVMRSAVMFATADAVDGTTGGVA